MGWAGSDFSGVTLTGFTDKEPWSIYGACAQLWRPTGMTPGMEYFKVAGIRLITNGLINVNIQLLTEGGVPVPGCAVAQRWNDPDLELPANSIPWGGDPRGKPNTGQVFFTNDYGIAQWNYGGESYFVPEREEGPYMYHIPMGPTGIASDVFYGGGWRGGRDHYHVEPIFTRYIVQETPPPGGEDWWRVLLKAVGQACLDAAAAP